MDRPCLVCHELCPVSPKAIFTRTVFETIRDGQALPAKLQKTGVSLDEVLPTWVNLASGDYYVRGVGQPESALRRITAAGGVNLILDRPLAKEGLPAEGLRVDIVVRLARPYVDPAKCIGCGMCEHECPVSGLRAIRVYSENESRSRRGRMLI
ncbi:MAG: 4Fe-4S binding protein [Thermodesulfobacteriota bacterium]